MGKKPNPQLITIASIIMVLIIVLVVIQINTYGFPKENLIGKAVDQITGFTYISCEEDDGGLKLFVKGFAQDEYLNRMGILRNRDFEDECEGSNTLREWYCDGNRLRSKKFTCNNGCDEGACKGEFTYISCEDSDLGKDLFVYGFAEDEYLNRQNIPKSRTLSDECVNETTVRERYCDGDRLSSKKFTCNNGCVEGACNVDDTSLDLECEDSDSGININTKGYVLKKSTNKIEAVLDFCHKGSDDFKKQLRECEGEGCYLTEISCDVNNNVVETSHKCVEGCLNEACSGGLNQVSISGNMVIDNILANTETEEEIITTLEGTKTPAEENLGEQKTLVILASIDGGDPPGTKQELEELVFGDQFGSVADFVLKDSYGKANIIGQVLGPYSLPRICEDVELKQELLKKADEEVNLEEFSRLILMFNSIDCLSKARGSIGKKPILLPNGKTHWMSITTGNSANNILLLHELGHNFGMHHASKYSCFDSEGNYVHFSLNCFSTEYGDETTQMGHGRGYPIMSGYNSAPHKFIIGWLSSENIQTASEGIYKIKPLELPLPSGEIQMLKIPIYTETSYYSGKDNVYYTLEFRRPIGYDTHLDDNFFGVSIRIAELPEDGSFTSTQTNVLKFGPNSNNWFLSLGESFIDNINGYNITVLDLNDNEAKIEVKIISKIEVNIGGPIVYFDFNDGTVNEQIGLISQVLVDGALPKEGGYYFDLRDEIELNSFPSTEISKNNKFAISFWMKSDDYSRNGNKLMYIDSISLNYKRGRTIRVQVPFKNQELFQDSGRETHMAVLEVNERLEPKNWHHITTTFDGTDLSIYINGQLRNSINSVTINGKDYPIDQLSITPSESKIGMQYSGIIDDFKIYARGLTPEEVSNIYNSFIPNDDIKFAETVFTNRDNSYNIKSVTDIDFNDFKINVDLDGDGTFGNYQNNNFKHDELVIMSNDNFYLSGYGILKYTGSTIEENGQIYLNFYDGKSSFNFKIPFNGEIGNIGGIILNGREYRINNVEGNGEIMSIDMDSSGKFGDFRINVVANELNSVSQGEFVFVPNYGLIQYVGSDKASSNNPTIGFKDLQTLEYTELPYSIS